MRSTFISFSIALLAVLGAYFFIPTASLISKQGGAMEEGYGVNRSSRKYFEYMRNRDPETGVVPEGIFERCVNFANHLPRVADRDYNWTSRGPYNIGGRTRAFAVDVLNSNHLIAGSVTGGMWNSLNGGQSWVKTTAPEQLQSVSCIAQDTRPGHENTWYYGSGEEFYGVVSGTSFTALLSGDGMWKSTDNGQSWFQLTSTMSGTPQNVLQNGSYDFVWRVITDHTNLNEDVVYAAVYNGIIRSNDGGNTWTEVLGFTSGASEFVDVMMTPSGVLYATFSDNSTNGGGFYRSTDGFNWTEISPVLPQIANLRRTVMCANPQNENEIYFLGETINNTFYPIDHFFYKYTYLGGDGSGADGSWENRSANLPSTPCQLFTGIDYDFATFRTQYSYDMCIAHHPTIPDLVFIGGTNLHRSTDAFATSTSVDWIGGYRCNVPEPWHYVYAEHHPDQHSITFDPANALGMYSLNDGGVRYTADVTADSVQWQSLNNGYLTSQFYTVAVEPGNTNSQFLMGGMQDNGTWLTHTSDASSPWREMHADDGAHCAIPFGADYVITSSQSGRIFKKSIDENGNLTGTERIDAENGPAALFINPLLLDPWTNRLFIAGNKMIWYLDRVDTISVTGNYPTARNTDDWNSVSTSTITLTQGSISCLDMAYTDNSVLYYGSSAGKLFKLTDLYGTPVKTNISSTLFPPNSYTSAVSTNDLNNNEVMVSFSNFNKKSIFHSTDAGATWADVSGNLEENVDGTGNGPAVYWVEIYPSTPTIYLAGTSAGLFSTSELNGESTVWQMEGANTIGNAVVNMITSRPFDGTVAVATHANGIFTANLPIVPEVSVEALAERMVTVSAFPNPTVDEIYFNMQLVPGEETVMNIYSLDGKLLSSKKWKAVGREQFSWEASHAGTFIYQLKSGSTTRTGKFVVTK